MRDREMTRKYVGYDRYRFRDQTIKPVIHSVPCQYLYVLISKIGDYRWSVLTSLIFVLHIFNNDYPLKNKESTNNFFFSYKIFHVIEINNKKEKKRTINNRRTKILRRKYKYIIKIISQLSCQGPLRM